MFSFAWQRDKKNPSLRIYIYNTMLSARRFSSPFFQYVFPCVVLFNLKFFFVFVFFQSLFIYLFLLCVKPLFNIKMLWYSRIRLKSGPTLRPPSFFFFKCTFFLNHFPIIFFVLTKIHRMFFLFNFSFIFVSVSNTYTYTQRTELRF